MRDLDRARGRGQSHAAIARQLGMKRQSAVTNWHAAAEGKKWGAHPNLRDVIAYAHLVGYELRLDPRTGLRGDAARAFDRLLAGVSNEDELEDVVTILRLLADAPEDVRVMMVRVLARSAEAVTKGA